MSTTISLNSDRSYDSIRYAESYYTNDYERSLFFFNNNHHFTLINIETTVNANNNNRNTDNLNVSITNDCINNVYFNSDAVDYENMNSNDYYYANNQYDEIDDRVASMIKVNQIDQGIIQIPNEEIISLNDKMINNHIEYNLNDEDNINYCYNEESALKNQDLEIYKNARLAQAYHLIHMYDFTRKSLRRIPWNSNEKSLTECISRLALSITLTYKYNGLSGIRQKIFKISSKGRLEYSQRNTIYENMIVIGSAKPIKCDNHKYLIPNDILLEDTLENGLIRHFCFKDMFNLLNNESCTVINKSKNKLKIRKANSIIYYIPALTEYNDYNANDIIEIFASYGTYEILLFLE